MKIKLITTITAILAVHGFTALHCFAQSVPNLINYQGRLTDQTGAALPQGLYQIQFRLWDSPTATNNSDLIWGQQYTATVQSNGAFGIILGTAGTTIANATPAVNDLSFAFTQSNRFMGITIVSSNGTSINGPSEILPRQQILSSPFSITSKNASYATLSGPVGAVIAFAGSQAPTGYLACDGSAVSRTTYSNLFTVVGTTFGTGDGVTTFNLPNMLGRVTVGMNTNDLNFNLIGNVGGSKTIDTTHTHNVPYYGWGATAAEDGTTYSGYMLTTDVNGWQIYANQSVATSVGGNPLQSILQPYMVLNWIIKY